MTGATRWRIGSTAVVGTIVAVVMIVLGMEPRLALLACIVAAAGCTTWLVVDLAGAASPVVWGDRAASADTAAPADRRVQTLRGWLRRPARGGRLRNAPAEEGAVPTDEIADVLLEVIADVLAEHGVDPNADASADASADPNAHPNADPAGAAAIVGPELARFIGDPAARRSMTQRRALAHTLALIEDLPSSISPDRRTAPS